MKKEKRSEVRRQEREVAIYCLRSTLPLHILKSLTTYYEKNCFVLNHNLNRHRVCRFLHATTGNNGNFDDSSDYESLTVAYTEETRSQEESAQDRGLAIGRGVAVRH
jgi:glucose-6-phosphate isomerase